MENLLSFLMEFIGYEINFRLPKPLAIFTVDSISPTKGKVNTQFLILGEQTPLFFHF